MRLDPELRDRLAVRSIDVPQLMVDRPERAREIPDARYAASVGSSEEEPRPAGAREDAAVRDPLAVPEAVIDARRRPMSERLELALNWNTVASELRAGLAVVKRGTTADR